MGDEFRIPFDEIADPQTITKVNQRLFREHGRELQRNECEFVDDVEKGWRVYQKVKASQKYFYSK